MKLGPLVVDSRAVNVHSTHPPREAPREFRVRYDADGHVELSWDYLSDALDYEVESTQIRLGSSFSTRLGEEDRRTFRVRGRNRHGAGPWSDPVQVMWTARRAASDLDDAQSDKRHRRHPR